MNRAYRRPAADLIARKNAATRARTESAIARQNDLRARRLVRSEAIALAAEREARETDRANRRNRNRSLTLLVALAMGFLVPSVLLPLLPAGFASYSFVVIIIPDALITLYAYVKRY